MKDDEARKRVREYTTQEKRSVKKGKYEIASRETSSIRTSAAREERQRETSSIKTYADRRGRKVSIQTGAGGAKNPDSDVRSSGYRNINVEKERAHEPTVIGSEKQRSDLPFTHNSDISNTTVKSNLLPKNKTCNTCGIKFLTREQQESHKVDFKEKRYHKLIHPTEFRRDLYMKILCPYSGKYFLSFFLI